MTVLSQSAWLIPVLYFISFVAVLSIGKSLKQSGLRLSTWLSLIAFAWSFAIIVERHLNHAPGYSKHLNWLDIGHINFTIGFEISNLTSLLLFISSGIFVLVHFMLQQRDAKGLPYAIVSYLSLLLFSLSSLLLADHLFMFIVSFILLSVSVFLIMSHPSQNLSYRDITKYLFPQLIAVMLLGAIAFVLFWHIPDSSLQFTRIQSIFGGQAHAFTTDLLQLLSLFVIGMILSSISFSTIDKGHMHPTLYYIITSITIGLVPLFIMLRFSELMQQVTGIHLLCLWIGIGIISWSTMLLLSKGKATSCYARMLIGLLLMAYGYEAYGYMVAIVMIWVLGLFLINLSPLLKGKAPQRTARVGLLFLGGVPLLSGFWIQQLIATKVYMTATSLEYIAVLFVISLVAGNTIIIAVMKQNQLVTERKGNPIGSRGSVMLLFIIITSLLIAVGFIWLFFNSVALQWLFDSGEIYELQLQPLLLSIVMTIGGVVLGYLYGKKRVSGQSINQNSYGSVEQKIIGAAQLLLKALSVLLFVFQQLFTVWITYPFRRWSRAASQHSFLYSFIVILCLSLVAALAYAVMGRD